MAETIVDGVRVKFTTEWIGTPTSDDLRLAGLTKAVSTMEALGCCPILGDGKSAGNGAILIDGRLFVTPSGRLPGHLDPAELVEVVSFDPDAWAATHRGPPSSQPTSDTPLYWTVLRTLQFPAPRPLVALHGHVLDTERAARVLDLPLSYRETEFSTAEDCRALSEVISRAPWPEHDTWIRRGHGFFCVAHDLAAASARVGELAARARDAGLL